ncbi:MAG: M20/M25/M40 family metallo-hydrolase [Gammaproteobacteria bacterium]|nr:M20/M25/M40 family metallo-hydrolase [Gammaproteobacteria bacterium]
MDLQHAARLIDDLWTTSITDELVEYIRIPAQSPHFDADWQANGHIDAATEHVARWCRAQPVDGLTVEVVRLAGRTPVIVMEVPGRLDDTVLLYGHLDKQPEMSGWATHRGPWQPVIEGERLYGRGGADDGYAAYASLAAIRALQAQGVRHPRYVLLIEACEESGSYDLPAYIEHLAPRIGEPSLVVCLDSGAGNYAQLWITTSLRGLVAGTLTVDILSEGVHSGYASGVVPSSFRLARQLLSRLEDETSGRILPAALQADIPAERRAQLAAVAQALGDEVHSAYPWVDGATPMGSDGEARLLARNWGAALSVTGAGGLPPIAAAGNVLRPRTQLKLSLRLPPTIDAEHATAEVKTLLETAPPHGARVRFEADQAASGWNAPAVAPWLDAACQASSRAVFGRPAMYTGEGGTIPFMAMLGRAFPAAQFLITGVLGPQSNAHGPNEFLHLAYVRQLNTVIAGVLAAQATITHDAGRTASR